MQNIAGSNHLQNSMDHLLRPFHASPPHTARAVSLAQNGADLGTMWGRRSRGLSSRLQEVELKQLTHDWPSSYYIAKRQLSGRDTTPLIPPNFRGTPTSTIRQFAI